MFCEPGSDWRPVVSGETVEEGWSVVNFTKPEGGELQVQWTLSGFDEGPAHAGVIFGTQAEWMDYHVFRYVDHHEQHARVQADSSGLEVDERITAGHTALGSSSPLVASLTMGPTFQSNELHIFQYAAGAEDADRTVEWEILADGCIDAQDVKWVEAQGGDVQFLTAEDLHGTLNAEVRLHAPLVPHNGAVALLEAEASTVVEGTPYINTWWGSDAGGLSLEGPNGVTDNDLLCFNPSSYTLCRAWGEYALTTLEPGAYTFEATGFTDPTQDPTQTTQGPYITLIPTELPKGGWS